MHAAVEEAWVIWDALAVANVRPQAAKLLLCTAKSLLKLYLHIFQLSVIGSPAQSLTSYRTPPWQPAATRRSLLRLLLRVAAGCQGEVQYEVCDCAGEPITEGGTCRGEA